MLHVLSEASSDENDGESDSMSEYTVDSDEETETTVASSEGGINLEDSSTVGGSDCEERQWPICEHCLVGASVGTGIKNTSELHVMKYDEAMATDPVGWTEAVDEEHQTMLDNDVMELSQVDEVPKDQKILSSTWAMKQKANEVKCGRVVC